jgi:hypothetical protein
LARGSNREKDKKKREEKRGVSERDGGVLLDKKDRRTTGESERTDQVPGAERNVVRSEQRQARETVG